MKKPNAKRAKETSEIVEQWEGLFILWKDGKHFRAELHPALEVRWTELRRGTHLGNVKNELLKPAMDAFERIAVAARAASKQTTNRTGDPCENPHKRAVAPSEWHYAEDVFSLIIAAVGKPMVDVFFAKETAANNGGTECKKILSAAIDAIIQDRFPGANGTPIRNGEIDCGVALNAAHHPDTREREEARAALAETNKPLAAIEAAKELCQELKRLPRKSEVIERLEMLGVSFSARSKDHKGKWMDCFERSGLAALLE